jgi:hypothetical protein
VDAPSMSRFPFLLSLLLFISPLRPGESPSLSPKPFPSAGSCSASSATREHPRCPETPDYWQENEGRRITPFRAILLPSFSCQ